MSPLTFTAQSGNLTADIAEPVKVLAGPWVDFMRVLSSIDKEYEEGSWQPLRELKISHVREVYSLQLHTSIYQ